MPTDLPPTTPDAFIAALGPISEADTWAVRLFEFRRFGGKWDAAWGPPPGAAGCRVPAHLLGGAVVARKGAVDRAPAEAESPPPIAADPPPPPSPITIPDPPKTSRDLLLAMCRDMGIRSVNDGRVTVRLLH